MKSNGPVKYDRLTPKLALQLAAPHTWAASVIPPLLATAMAFAATGTVSVSLSIAVLLISVLMQSAVNTFNDYYDFVKGSDSKADNVEESDATLLYNNLNKKHVLALAIGFLAVAFLLGIYCIYRSGWISLVIALIGAFFVVFYSAGKTPISYLPIGELVSGFVMGGLIPLASYQVITGSLSMVVLLWSIPSIIGIGLIMMTNNTCDIEKDIQAKRKTLPIILGRERATLLYRILVALWIVSIIILVGIFFEAGLILIPFMLLGSIPLLKALLSNPLLPATRIAGMAQICSCNIALGAFYAAAIFASSFCALIF